MEFGTYPTGWYIEGDLPNQVAVSTGSTVHYKWYEFDGYSSCLLATYVALKSVLCTLSIARTYVARVQSSLLITTGIAISWQASFMLDSYGRLHKTHEGRYNITTDVFIRSKSGFGS